MAGRSGSDGRDVAGRVALVGCGFVADLYMRSLRLYPRVEVVAVHDRDPDRQAAFAASEDQQERIVAIVNKARREVYGVLGED